VNDYFTVEEFRSFVSPTKTAQWGEDEITSAQAEVIDLLEEWAASAWPNVTGTTGDGTAELPRSAIETHDAGVQYLFLRVPIIDVVSIELDGTAVDPDSFDVIKLEGVIAFDSRLQELSQGLVVEYTYGHTVCPSAIKRPAMMATLGLLQQEKGGGAIPSNVQTYTTDRTTVVLNAGPERDERPWSWHEAANRRVRGYWGPRRPRDLVGVGGRRS
jgi:hypothetical protein